MLVVSSEGGRGHKSYLWFQVNSTVMAFYQFWYYSYGDDSAKLSTTYEASGETFDIPIMNKDRWIKTDCFPVPHSSDGKIYIIAEHGGGNNEDIVIDNLRLAPLCTSKY